MANCCPSYTLYMAGVAVSGVLWAIFQNNAGGAWDNAKKSFEAGVMIDGEMTFKGSEAHKASVTGDTVGDPFKDTSGPSMNILIKLTCLVGLVIAPILGGGHESHAAGEATHIEVRREVIKVKMNAVKVQISGAVFEGLAMADVAISTDNGSIDATFKVTSEDGAFSGKFTAKEGMFDGMMFHADGSFETVDGEQFMCVADFFRNVNGDVQDFHMDIH